MLAQRTPLYGWALDVEDRFDAIDGIKRQLGCPFAFEYAATSEKATTDRIE
jgi:hypothetical protein